MKQLSVPLFVIVFFLNTLAMKAQPPAHEVTEVWEPVPEVVTPGVGTAPPSDAKVLFDGTSMDGWLDRNGDPAGCTLEDCVMTVVPGTGDIHTSRGFGDIQLHLEWRTPGVVVGECQGRGNSGVFLMNRYEVQILDSYENPTYPNGQAASVYKQHIPLVNASRGPGEWQTYDIIFTAPRFNEDGRVAIPARVTVIHNGVLVQNNVEIWGETEFIGLPSYKEHSMREPIRLQDHNDLVSFRNIWVREL